MCRWPHQPTTKRGRIYMGKMRCLMLAHGLQVEVSGLRILCKWCVLKLGFWGCQKLTADQDDGSFVMYFADEIAGNPAHHCVGVATSQTILGPYKPQDTPFACPIDQGGAIDADGFQDVDGKRYVVYKVDGNSIGHGGECMNSAAPIVPTPIMLQEVAEDGVTLIGEPTEILNRDDFDGPLIEAPSLHRSNEGIYFLFFSSNCFTGPLYDTSYATATSIYGPYTKAERPLFITGDGPDLRGPGGSDIVKDGSRVVLHGHLDDTTGYVGYAPRGMYTAQLTFNGRTVTAQ
jgi:beta-xylosidase